eukprot:9518548-Alexandrium_andersonii.AAC.1
MQRACNTFERETFKAGCSAHKLLLEVARGCWKLPGVARSCSPLLEAVRGRSRLLEAARGSSTSLGSVRSF